MGQGKRVLIYDSGQGYLTSIWKNSAFLGRFDLVIPASTWEMAALDLRVELPKLERSGFPEYHVSAVQVWGHGMSGAPYIGGRPIPLELIADELDGYLSPTSYVWFRSCDVFSRAAGVAFARDAVAAFRCGVVGHTRIVSLPNPLCQSGGHGLLPGRSPQWGAGEGVGDDGRSLGSGFFVPNTCLVTAMDPPSAWWRT